ncbi:hypothetical protein DXG03_009222 [Asterophora parasitica]|uniref:FAD synthase n=1 Tax=Asterophora parasitica TaxID=117018 RepID=A0A9P7GBI3_9AGAR|nr:hypothetical protein DXG03_009222 [Asterophora parasitica]
MDCRKIAQEVYDLAGSNDPLAPMVKEALEVIDQGLDTHGQEAVSISFNGGKDCTVLLHLYAGALARRLEDDQPVKPIPAVYIPVPSPFPVLETFIEQSAATYNLDLFHCFSPTEPVESVVTPSPGLPAADYFRQHRAVGKAKGGQGMKESLEAYKKKFPRIEAVLIGTRRTDPHGESFASSSPSTSSVISPATALTSVMSTTHDHPQSPAKEVITPTGVLSNSISSVPTLQATNGHHTPESNPSSHDVWKMSGVPEPRYRPAYELLDGNLERCGRGLSAGVRAGP